MKPQRIFSAMLQEPSIQHHCNHFLEAPANMGKVCNAFLTVEQRDPTMVYAQDAAGATIAYSLGRVARLASRQHVMARVFETAFEGCN